MDKLSLSGVDAVQAAKELSRVVETVTCIECCKIYILPETAVCGHTLCHGCWIGRPTCPVCASHLKRRSLKSNVAIKKYSECAQALVASFEKLFNVKLDEYTQEIPAKAPIVQKDPIVNVKAWLADSQNQFSAPVSSQQSTQAGSSAVEVRTCDIQIHTSSKKSGSPHKKIIAPPPPQDDWDKIETIPDAEDFTKNKENVGPINIELFSFEDEAYTTDNPRRSSRKRELKNDSKPSENSLDKHSSSNLSIDTEKFNKAKQNWSNVKRMRKEFSKLHKKNKNKLNVSIEMCKKSQNPISKAITTIVDDESQQIIIDDCSPNVNQNQESKESAAMSDIVVIDKKTKNDNENMSNPNNASQKNAHMSQPINITQNNEENSQNANKKNSSNPHNVIEVHPENSTKPTDSNKGGVLQGNIPFLRKSTLQIEQANESSNNDNVKTVNHVINHNTETPDSDDIQITIKIGSTLTNIFIKKKKNDVKVKLNTDQEAQTYNCIDKSISCNISPSAPKDSNVQNIEISIGGGSVVSAHTQQKNDDEPGLQNKLDLDKGVLTKKNTESAETVPLQPGQNKVLNLDRTVSTKKNTASAETVPFEITESVEKELSKIMECDDEKNNEIQEKSVKSTQIEQQDANMLTGTGNADKQEDNAVIDLDDVDIFASGSVKNNNVQVLKESHAPSEILMPTLKQSKNVIQTQRQADKRDREMNDDEIPCNKKLKVTPEIKNKLTEEILQQDKDVENENCSMNYDLVMVEVFASIDADMENIDKSQSIIKQNASKNQTENCGGILMQQSQSLKTQKSQKKVLGPSKLANASQIRMNDLHQKESENLFTLSNKESQVYPHQKHGPETQAHIENILTPGMCRDLASSSNVVSHIEPDNDGIQATPCHDKDDSDMSIYEDTPQKSFTKKSSNDAGSTSNNSQGQHHKINSSAQIQNQQPNDTQAMRSVIDISDADITKTQKDITVVEPKRKQTLHMDTPSTINKFCDQVKHNSTPVARKSLNFISNQDKAQNLSTSILALAKNTQEQEIIAKAFEPTQKSFTKPLPQKKYCIAASCLTSAEVKVVETLCVRRGWLFMREYTNDLTHLVVGADKDGRSQRTVKFMCAVAAGKWIVRYEWIEQCLLRGPRAPPDEGPYEALDWTGDPGPMRARTATKKLFEGITFFCKPPFTVLNETVLKSMLQAAGGCVVDAARQARVAGDGVRLLLAEPEHTQENQYTYLALELSIVPVNYEWALNCLGSYTLNSIVELLLCPYSLLPAATQRWPADIIAQDFDTPSDDDEQ